MTVVVFSGQGAQRKGMGRELFARHPALIASAEQILGLSLGELVESERLDQTQFTQPALFVVNALAYIEWRENAGADPRFAAGHSLGEYNALHAAGAFDFETGVRLVKLRGELMGRARAGSMAAVIGMTAGQLRHELGVLGATAIDLANDNSPSQQVISGPRSEIERITPALRDRGLNVVPLRVSAAFHSRYMGPAREEYALALAREPVGQPRLPVVSNVEARPYEPDRVRELLARQIDSPVQWTDSVRYLIDQGAVDFEEIGPTKTLTKLVAEIREHAMKTREVRSPAPAARTAALQPPAPGQASGASRLGSAAFCGAYGARLAYVAGAMYKGIASKEFVIRMGQAGLLSFFGTGGLRLDRIRAELAEIRSALPPGSPWGVNLLCNLDHPAAEDEIVELCLQLGVRNVEAAAYIQPSRAVIRFRARGLSRDAGGNVVARHRVLAKISRPEVARAFMSPASAEVLDELVRRGELTAAEAMLARELPIASDICVEADSGGHTDRGALGVLLPAILDLRGEHMRKYGYRDLIQVGGAGGIGSPEAAACVFLMGADFILTGSINQCTVEAGTSEAVKDILEKIDIQDTTYAPAGDMFELGAVIQVVRKGLLFPSRANRLYALYQQFDDWSAIDNKTRSRIEQTYFGRSFDDVWSETSEYYARSSPETLVSAARAPKKKMALVFRWYFVHTTRLALRGEPGRRTDYQIHCGPALGAFNRWVRGTGLASWRNRHPDVLGQLLMDGAERLLRERLTALTSASRR